MTRNTQVVRMYGQVSVGTSSRCITKVTTAVTIVPITASVQEIGLLLIITTASAISR